MPTLTSIAHGKEGSITFVSQLGGSGSYGANCFDVSLSMANNGTEVTTFDSPDDFVESIPGKTTATGSFSVWVDDTTAMGLGDFHFNTGQGAPAFPALTIVLGTTTVTLGQICITGVSSTQDPNGVPAFVCSYVSVGDFTSA